MTTASICTIGDEILIGQILNTNSAEISRALNSAGIRVRFHFSIGDIHEEIISRLEMCLEHTDIVIVTGGLGPTRDDITKLALKELSMASSFVRSEEQYRIIERLMSARGIEMIESNREQASVPNTCDVIPNELGTAPCMVFRGLGSKGTSTLYSLPGVPFETIGLMPKVIDDIRTHFNLEHITHHTIVTFGIPESTLAKQIENWENALPENIKLAYLPNPTIGVRLRLSHYGEEEPDFTPYISSIKEILGDAIYGEGEDNLQTVIGRKLRSMGRTLAVAESCTGGRISELITQVAGCSDYYKGSVISYANEVKTNLLGVPAETIETHGAVSEQTAIAMSTGLLKLLDTDYTIATTGVAGPGGGTSENPVGTAWLAVASRDRVVTKKVKFSSNRVTNIERFASNALNLLRLEIEFSGAGCELRGAGKL
jgi:nicotinamide-nucleotide amidase